MHNASRNVIFSLVCLVLALDGGCQSLVHEKHSNKTIQLFAASSTTDAVQSIQSAFLEATGYEIELTLGGSSTLANQIIQGAPADLFLSANEDWCDEVLRQSPQDGCQKAALLGNRLVLIVHKDSEWSQLDLETFPTSLGQIAVANTETVPAGIYAKQALQHLGVWDQITPALIPSNNVRAALQYVETQSVPLGIVYATDAAASPHVRVVYEFDPAWHQPIRYPLLRLCESGHPAKDALFEFLQGKKAAEIFQQKGFSRFTSEDNESIAPEGS